MEFKVCTYSGSSIGLSGSYAGPDFDVLRDQVSHNGLQVLGMHSITSFEKEIGIL